MPTVISDQYGEIAIPASVVDVRSFLDWIDTADLPEKLPVSFVRGEVRVDLAMEELFAHNQLKMALGVTLGGLVEQQDLGFFIPDGMLFVNDAAELVTIPDAIFVTHDAVTTKRVAFTAGKSRGAVATRVVGSPDLIVEIVSRSSEVVDTEWLMSAYHDAGVREYWVIDARGDDLRFVIYSRREREFVAVRRSAGWLRSGVLNQSFRFVSQKTVGIYPRLVLEMR